MYRRFDFDFEGLSVSEIIMVLTVVMIALIIAIAFSKELSFGEHSGIVVDKQYQAAFVTYTSSNVNGSTISIPTTYPERWTIKLQKDNKALWVNVSEKEYEEIKIGDCYNCQGE